MIRNTLEGDVPNDTLLFWPETYGLNVEDGMVEVLDKAGRVVARRWATRFRSTPSDVTYGQATKHGGLDKITPACSGGYWAVEQVIEPSEDAHKGSVPIISVETSLIQNQTLPPRTVQDLVNRSQAIVVGTVTEISKPVVELALRLRPRPVFAGIPESEWPSIEVAYWTIDAGTWCCCTIGNVEANPKLRMEPNPYALGRATRCPS